MNVSVTISLELAHARDSCVTLPYFFYEFILGQRRLQVGDLVPLRLEQVSASHIDILEQKDLYILRSKMLQLFC